MQVRCYRCSGFRALRQTDAVPRLKRHRKASLRIPKIGLEDRPKMPSFACPEPLSPRTQQRSCNGEVHAMPERGASCPSTVIDRYVITPNVA
jgi:hypothetical protein